MLKRSIVVGLLIGLSVSASLAGQFEKEIKREWLGAWVLLNIEGYSHCNGGYTNNRVNGDFVKSGGSTRFEPGELAKLDKLDIKRSRLDLQLSLFEPVLVSYAEGPFTLYREARCKIELEVMLPRDVVKSKETGAVVETLLAILERHARRDDAMRSLSWNERERDELPEDYDRTLAELEVWRAEQTNKAIERKLALATQKTYRLSDRVSSDPYYLAGFAVGVEEAKSLELDNCSKLVAVDLEKLPGRSTPANDTDDLGRERNQRGFTDGKMLILGLELLRRLPDCRVNVPDVDSVLVGANR